MSANTFSANYYYFSFTFYFGKADLSFAANRRPLVI